MTKNRTLRIGDSKQTGEVLDYDRAMQVTVSCLHCKEPLFLVEYVPPLTGGKGDVFVSKLRDTADMSWDNYRNNLQIGLCLKCTLGNYFRDIGHKEGFKEAESQGYKDAWEDGYRNGREDAWEAGYEKGQETGRSEGYHKARNDFKKRLGSFFTDLGGEGIVYFEGSPSNSTDSSGEG